jgi:GGDEF domain-containing protein
MNLITDRAVFRDDAQRLRWTLRQRQNILRLPPEEFGWMMQKHAEGWISVEPPETDLRSAKPKPKSVNQFSEKLVSQLTLPDRRVYG